jgi:hypothetical protein
MERISLPGFMRQVYGPDIWFAAGISAALNNTVFCSEGKINLFILSAPR